MRDLTKSGLPRNSVPSYSTFYGRLAAVKSNACAESHKGCAQVRVVIEYESRHDAKRLTNPLLISLGLPQSGQHRPERETDA